MERWSDIKSVWPVKLQAVLVNSASCFLLSFYMHPVLCTELWRVSRYCGGTKAPPAQCETFRFTYLLIERAHSHCLKAQAQYTTNTTERDSMLCSWVHLGAVLVTVILGDTVMLFQSSIHQLCTGPRSTILEDLNSLRHPNSIHKK